MFFFFEKGQKQTTKHQGKACLIRVDSSIMKHDTRTGYYLRIEKLDRCGTRTDRLVAKSDISLLLVRPVSMIRPHTTIFRRYGRQSWRVRVVCPPKNLSDHWPSDSCGGPGEIKRKILFFTGKDSSSSCGDRTCESF